jgi:hypothetical protein
MALGEEAILRLFRVSIFRYILADHFNPYFNDNLAHIAFRLQTGDPQEGESIVDQVSVAMTPRSLKTEPAQNVDERRIQVMGTPLVWVLVFITCYAGYAGWSWPFAVVIGMIAGVVDVARLTRDLGAAVLLQTPFQTIAFGAAYFSALYWFVRWLTH